MVLRCEVCRLELNSPQQLAQHNAGEKHRKKLRASGLPVSPTTPPSSRDSQGKPVTPCSINFVRQTDSSADDSCGAGELDGPNAEPLSKTSPESSNGSQIPDTGIGTVTRPQRTTSSRAEAPSGERAGSLGAGNPVDLAVVDNAMGRLPCKRKLVAIFCETCKISFNSQSQADAHFSGSKHAKKLKIAAEAGADKPGSLLYCSFCDVHVNSPPQMDAHRSGSKHKARVEKCRAVAQGLLPEATDSQEAGVATATPETTEPTGKPQQDAVDSAALTPASPKSPASVPNKSPSQSKPT